MFDLKMSLNEEYESQFWNFIEGSIVLKDTHLFLHANDTILKHPVDFASVDKWTIDNQGMRKLSVKGQDQSKILFK